MWSFDFPRWSVALVYLHVFVVCSGIGADLGFAATYATLIGSAREGGRVPKGRLARIGPSLRGALAGGVPNFVVVYSGSRWC